MNEYCKHIIVKFHQSFLARTFDQDDVALLIVLTREYTRKGRVLRELGDFLAHPEEKDRGLVLDSVRRAATFFEKDCRRYFEDPDFKPPVVSGLGPIEELLADIVGVFQLAGISSPVIGEDDDNFRDFVFCVIFLLSSFRINYEGRLLELKVEYAHSLTLLIAYESTNYLRHFALLPIFNLSNVWIQCPTFSKHSLRRHIARRFKEGSLCAIAYEDDLGRAPLSAKDFERGNFWPLPNVQRRY